MKIKILNISLVIIFMTMLIFPMIFINPNGGTSERENRMLTKLPSLSIMFQHPLRFIKQFDAWFSDNVGLREELIDIYIKIDRFGSRNHYMDGAHLVLIGKDGHHFNTHYGQTLEIYQGKHWLSDGQSEELAISLNKLNNYLDEKGIPLIVMLMADKESIYPEYYPEQVIRGPEPIALDVITQYLNEETDVDIFNIKKCFLEERENYLLFPKTGNSYELTHYNETGAFLAYRELMQHINAYFPSLHSYMISDVIIEYTANGSSDVTLKNEVTYKQIKPRYFDDAIEFENDDLSLPTLLILRDSYANEFVNYLPQHFGRSIFQAYNSIGKLTEYIDVYQPDIIVLESAERCIPDFAQFITDYQVPVVK